MAIFKRNKVETVPFNSFMDGSFKMTKEEKETVGLTALMSLVTIVKSHHVHASGVTAALGSGFAQDKIMRALDPLVELIQGISYPVALIMLSGGALLIMLGQKHRGIGMIKSAAIGYIGMQFIPALMEILVEIGRGIRGR